jgi:hypothetical protein
LKESPDAALSRAIQQNLRADDVRTQELISRSDTAIDVRLGCKVYYGIRFLFESGQHGASVANIPADKAVPGPVQTFQVVEIARVSESIKICNAQRGIFG